MAVRIASQRVGICPLDLFHGDAAVLVDSDLRADADRVDGARAARVYGYAVQDAGSTHPDKSRRERATGVRKEPTAAVFR